jgi:exosortase
MASLADRLPERRGSAKTSTPIPWAALGWVAALLVFCYLPILVPLVRQWSRDDDLGHAFFVLPVAAYITWLRRGELLDMTPVPNYWGLAIIAWGALQLLVGTLGAELFLQRTSLIITLAGCILLTCGGPILKKVWFPLFLLLFMVPLPRILFTQITFPLQLLASRIAEWALSALNIPVLRDGNVLELASQRLNVVEACSGIRSLLSLSFLSLVYGFLFDRKPWMRWVLWVLTVPIAIIANAGRVTITGILSEYQPEFARGFFHNVEGWAIFLVALFMLVLTHRLINLVFSSTDARKRPSAIS